jgi:carbon-monoxide dehydrogenase medium subunit
MKQRLAAPTDLIDLAKLPELKGIKASGSDVSIGGAETHFDVAQSADVKKAIPTLAQLAGSIGDPAVRHKGTIGGSLANNDPAADYPAAALALGATIETNKRKNTADEFFQGMFTTALEEGEVIVRVSFPVAERAGYQKFLNPASRYAMAGVFVARTKAGIRVAVTGAGNNGVFRYTAMEEALAKSFTPDAVAKITPDPADMLSDLHGSSEYRANLVTVMAKRAVAAAIG